MAALPQAHAPQHLLHALVHVLGTGRLHSELRTELQGLHGTEGGDEAVLLLHHCCLVPEAGPDRLTICMHLHTDFAYLAD